VTFPDHRFFEVFRAFEDSELVRRFELFRAAFVRARVFDFVLITTSVTKIKRQARDEGSDLLMAQ
jgi:hypothetical protein